MKSKGVDTILIEDRPLIAENPTYGYDVVMWHKKRKELWIILASIPFGDKKSNHNYDIRFTIEDVINLLVVLAERGTADDPQFIAEKLSPHLPSLVKLLSCAVEPMRKSSESE